MAMCRTKIGFRSRVCFARRFTKIDWFEFRKLSQCDYAAKFVFWKFYLIITFQRYSPCECSVCFLTSNLLSELVLKLPISK